MFESRKEKKKAREREMLEEAEKKTAWRNDGYANHQYALRKPRLVFVNGRVIEYGYCYKCDYTIGATYGKPCDSPDCRTCKFVK